MNDIFADLESMEVHGIPLVIARRLRAKFPGKHVLTTKSGHFHVDVWEASREGRRVADPTAINVDPVGGDREEFWRTRTVGWERVDFKGQLFEVFMVALPAGFHGTEQWHFVVGSDEPSARELFLSVVEWNQKVHGEILVFEAGCFCKSKELQDDIGAFSLDDLVLAGELGATLRNDLRRFLDSKEVYRKAKAPWKRGLLFLGPPGNGKTHALKGLLRESGLPCIYVKSFGGRHVNPHETIPKVFGRARELAPCVLVLEDLDSLIDDDNRSLLLNELDGFARNEGIITIATTNHPDRLDPSLLHRPSRFDRKFQFQLPELAERTRYLERWAQGLDGGMRPSAAAITEAGELTLGFTFAYLKEATLSALVEWAGDGGAQSMDAILKRVLDGLVKEIAAMPAGAEPARPKPRKMPFDMYDY